MNARIDDERLPKLMPMIAEGVPRHLIAERLGITLDALNVWCWYRGIKLPPGKPRGRGRPGKYGLKPKGVSECRWKALNEGRPYLTKEEIKSRASSQPWKQLGISRQAWHQRKKRQAVDSTAA